MIPNCYWMIGISGSGKTTKAQELIDEGKAQVIISSDSIRKELYGDENIQGNPNEVFSLVHERCVSYLKMGISIVYDATNLSLKYRRKFFTYLRNNNVIAKHHAVVMCTPFTFAYYQNLNRERIVPLDVIKGQYQSFHMPFWEEGFKTITLDDNTKHFISITENDEREHPYKEEQFNSLLALMKDFDQKNKHHSLLLLDHCNKVKEYTSEFSDDTALILASQIHDIGKLKTITTDENGENHYYSHAEAGCYTLLSNLDCLNLNVSETIKCLFYVCYHMYPASWLEDKTKERYRKIFGAEKYNNLWLLHQADKRGC